MRRFGPEVADTLASAAIAGIYCGDISRLSLGACFPSAARIDAEVRSLLLYGLRRAMRRLRSKSSRRWQGLVSVD